MNILLPNAVAALVLPNGRPTPEFYDFLRSLASAAQSDQQAADLSAFIARLEALEQSGAAPTINGPLSVEVFGSLAQGAVSLQLSGDVMAPGAGRYYGTNSAGLKGYHALPSAGTFNRIDTSGDPRVTADGNLRITA